MADLNGFNAHDVDPNPGFDPVPTGKYAVVITATEMKPTKNGKGEYLEVEMEVIEGSFKGRRLWDRLTLKHPNEQTVEIARGTLSAICRAVNVMQPRDSAQLHSVPLVASVALKNRDDTGEPTNVVKGYAKRETAAPSPRQERARGERKHATVEAVAPGITLELPYPPSVNHYWRRVGRQTLISREGRSYRTRVMAQLAPRRLQPLDGRLHVHVALHPPDRRRRDLDNPMKSLLDSLAHGGVYRDDGQIDRLDIWRHGAVPGGKAVVTVTEMAR